MVDQIVLILIKTSKTYKDMCNLCYINRVLHLFNWKNSGLLKVY